MKIADRYAQVLLRLDAAIPDAETELQYRSPYELLVATVLAAQCTDKRINQISPALFARFPDAAALAAGTVEEIFGLIRSVSYPNNKAKHLAGLGARLISAYGGEVPASVDDLQTLPGVGRKTANVIASIIFQQPTMAVDTHVFRVSHRLGLVPAKAKTPLAVELALYRYIPQLLIPRAHHWLILHGRYVCVARTPKCTECPLTDVCRYYELMQRRAARVAGLADRPMLALPASPAAA